MPIHFSITHPRTSPCYDPMNPSDPIRVEGTYTGATPSQMWYLTGQGLPPTGTSNPWEAGAIAFNAALGGKWDPAAALAVAADGFYWVRIWSVQPGSCVINDDVRTFCVQSSIPVPPAPAMAAPQPANGKKAKKKKKK